MHICLKNETGAGASSRSEKGGCVYGDAVFMCRHRQRGVAVMDAILCSVSIGLLIVGFWRLIDHVRFSGGFRRR